MTLTITLITDQERNHVPHGVVAELTRSLQRAL
jgi:hypothetical protein